MCGAPAGIGLCIQQTKSHSDVMMTFAASMRSMPTYLPDDDLFVTAPVSCSHMKHGVDHTGDSAPEMYGFAGEIVPDVLEITEFTTDLGLLAATSGGCAIDTKKFAAHTHKFASRLPTRLF
jgi:hypothetical protein